MIFKIKKKRNIIIIRQLDEGEIMMKMEGKYKSLA